MINRDRYAEAYAIAGRMMKALVAFPVEAGEDGATMRSTVGKFLVNFPLYIEGGTVGTELLACFDAARRAGGTMQSFDGVRDVAMSETPRYLLGNAIVNAGIIFAFVEQTKLIINMTFTSRERVAELMDGLGIVVDDVKLAKSNSFPPNDYQNYVALSASLFQHLSVKERQLPRVIPMHFAAHLPALTLSNRIYGTGSRSDELIDENKTIHPAFMQRDIIALSE